MFSEQSGDTSDVHKEEGLSKRKLEATDRELV